VAHETHSVVRTPYASWFKLDPKAMTATKIDKEEAENDPQVIAATELGVNFLPGSDLFQDADEVLRLLNTQLVKQIGILRDELAARPLQAVAANEMLIDSIANPGELTLMHAEVQKWTDRHADLAHEYVEYEDKVTSCIGKAKARIAELETSVSESAAKLTIALADKATFESELNDSRLMSASKSTEISNLTIERDELKGKVDAASKAQKAAEDALATLRNTPPPVQPAAAPAAAVPSAATPTTPAPQARSAKVLAYVDRNKRLKAGLAIAAAILLLFAVKGMWHPLVWSYTPAEQVASNSSAVTPVVANCDSVSSDLKAANASLTYTKAVLKTTEGARDAANDLAAVAFSELEKTKRALVASLPNAPAAQAKPVDQPAATPLKNEEKPNVDAAVVPPKGDAEQQVATLPPTPNPEMNAAAIAARSQIIISDLDPVSRWRPVKRYCEKGNRVNPYNPKQCIPE
jgi:hypothetical protein